ncbi:MAG: DeoR/GlpR family DNA-binding transcription regulator [Anaerovibrio sp.]|uniref:DeoR/GlpR family DNA-binding transcription regulator n=1 Tax=Anaerovibrio sp. TaxID=1872532 RepID=UPI0025D66487|nr:DeoR/GlpR family DNA-binding transcription regulator [Anaerovibrio sp.]MCR5175363.1 DeoR/GlpR family DNA-binding transcription regulator [Anaerovibrio sp.]
MKINRIQKIRELLEDTHNVSINTLCETFNVSKYTIRRDINELEKAGFLKKVYGGVVLKKQEHSSPEPFSLRENRNVQQKKEIARIAASLVQDGDIIYIDSGTTTMHMLPFLVKHQHLTIVTASVYVINAAAALNQFNLIATGGTLYMPSMAFVGPSVLNCLKDYNISKAFMASTGVSIEHGVTNASPLESEIKRSLIQKPAKKYLLADTSKLDIASLISYCDLRDLDGVVMEKTPPSRYIDYFKQNNVALLTKDTTR